MTHLFSTLLPEERSLLSDVCENAKTVATAFAKFPVHNNQCDTCLRHVDNPVMSPEDYTALIHSTNCSRAAVKEFVWERVLKQIDEELNEATTRETGRVAIRTPPRATGSSR